MIKIKEETPPPDYIITECTNADEIIERALNILRNRLVTKSYSMTEPKNSMDYIELELSGREHEVFCIMLLDTKHKLIDFVELFRGTIDDASVHPREVVKEVLKHNATAVILAHNHPSGNPSPSNADEQITKRLKDALALIDVHVLDHIVIGDTAISMAEKGLI